MSNETPFEELIRFVRKETPGVEEIKGSPDLGRKVSQELGISGAGLLRSVSTGPLPPDDTDDLLYGFAKGDQTRDERELAETLLEINPDYWSDIRIYREELADAALTSREPARAKQGSGARILRPFSLAWGIGSAACLLAVLILYRDTGDKLKLTQQSLTVASLERNQLDAKAKSLETQQQGLNSQIEDARKGERVARVGLEGKDRDLQKLRQELLRSRQNSIPNAAKNSTLPETVAFEDGRKWIRINGQTVIVPSKSDVQEALSGTLEAPPIPSLKTIPTSAGLSEIPLVSPDMTKIGTLQPVLRWVAPPGGKVDSYEVRIFQRNQTVATLTSHDLKLQIAPDLLKAGDVYGWSVTATLSDGSPVESRTGKFAVLDQRDLDTAQSELSNPSLGHLEKALFAAKLSLFDEAEQQLKQVRFVDLKLKQRLEKSIKSARQ